MTTFFQYKGTPAFNQVWQTVKQVFKSVLWGRKEKMCDNISVGSVLLESCIFFSCQEKKINLLSLSIYIYLH